MQCGVEERTIRNVRMVAVKCFKYREEGHKCRWYSLWKRKVKRMVHPKEGKCKGDWAPDSRRILSYITVCGYNTTHFQENPQRLG